MKKINIKNKILLLLSFVFIFISSFAISTFAYHEDSNGNLVSDNLYNIGTYSTSIFGVSVNVENQTLTLNGTSTSGSWDNRPNLSITLDAGTYTMQWFTDYVGNNIGFGIRNSSSGLSELYQLNSQRYKTFTISETTTFTTVIWWQAGGLTFNNVSVSCMIYSGSYNSSISFEPYAVYYSQSNYDNAYNNGFETATYNSFKSIMYYANFEEIYLKYESNDNHIRYMGIVYGGRFCDSDVNVKNDLWSNPDYQYPITSNWETNISSSYGLFYMTPYSIYNFIDDYGSVPTVNPDAQALMYMKFIVPQNLFNVNFKLASWQRVRFIDIYGKITDFTSTQGVFSVELYNISEILLFGNSDFSDDVYYLVSDPSSASFNNGYNLGFNDGIQQNTDKISDLNSQIVTLRDTINTLQGQIENMQNSTSNYQHLLWTIASTPWESFNKIWNVEFGGINIANIVTGFVTALLVIYLIKKIWK